MNKICFLLACIPLTMLAPSQVKAQSLCGRSTVGAGDLRVIAPSGQGFSQSVQLSSSSEGPWSWAAASVGSGQVASAHVENTSVDVSGNAVHSQEGFVALELCFKFGSSFLYPPRRSIGFIHFTPGGISAESQGVVFFNFPFQPGITQAIVHRASPNFVITIVEVAVPGGIFTDGFEAGNTSSWSVTAP